MSIASRLERIEARDEPVPAAVPGEFVIYLGVDDVPEGLEAGMVELLLTWLEWVEVEVQGFPDLVEELHRLRGTVMVAAVAGKGSRIEKAARPARTRTPSLLG